jgi:histidine triad (HIT) family protein
MDQVPDCIFCKIVNREVESNILYETDNIIIIKDIMPKAPVHVQVMPKRHIQSLNELNQEDMALAGELILSAKNYASQAGIAESGFKLVVNTGKEGGQVVPHLHIHVLGGKQLEE